MSTLTKAMKGILKETILPWLHKLLEEFVKDPNNKETKTTLHKFGGTILDFLSTIRSRDETITAQISSIRKHIAQGPKELCAQQVLDIATQLVLLLNPKEEERIKKTGQDAGIRGIIKYLEELECKPESEMSEEEYLIKIRPHYKIKSEIWDAIKAAYPKPACKQQLENITGEEPNDLIHYISDMEEEGRLWILKRDGNWVLESMDEDFRVLAHIEWLENHCRREGFHIGGEGVFLNTILRYYSSKAGTMLNLFFGIALGLTGLLGFAVQLRNVLFPNPLYSNFYFYLLVTLYIAGGVLAILYRSYIRMTSATVNLLVKNKAQTHQADPAMEPVNILREKLLNIIDRKSLGRLERFLVKSSKVKQLLIIGVYCLMFAFLILFYWFIIPFI